MPRLYSGCLALCCISRKKRKSFPIHEKQHETEVNKVFIRHIGSVRVTPLTIINHQQDKKTKSKATIKNKSDDTEFNGETHLSDQQTKKQSINENNSSYSRTHISKLFHKSKQLQTPSPLPMTVSDTLEENHDKTAIHTSSSWSSSTSSDFNQHKKRSKHRSCVDSYDFSKENNSQKMNISPPKKISNDIKSPAKSKLVLENVRKMIKDQNIQQQHFNHTRQKESARL